MSILGFELYMHLQDPFILYGHPLPFLFGPFPSSGHHLVQRQSAGVHCHWPNAIQWWGSDKRSYVVVREYCSGICSLSGYEKYSWKTFPFQWGASHGATKRVSHPIVGESPILSRNHCSSKTSWMLQTTGQWYPLFYVKIANWKMAIHSLFVFFLHWTW